MKHFFVILGITLLVWVGLSLSDRQTYTLNVQVEYTGYDTVAYAVRRADTVVTLRVESNGFGVLGYNMVRSHQPVCVELPDGGSGRSVAFADVADQFRRQLGFGSSVTSVHDSLMVQLVARESRRYKVDLSNVRFAFARQCGLYGQPVVSPDSITLFGPADQLDAIACVKVADTNLAGIDTSGVFFLPLSPVWRQYTDVHAAVRQVQVRLHVERFMEHRYKVPVAVQGADTGMLFKVYPPAVELRVWVADRDADFINGSRFATSINYADVLHGRECKVNIDTFPALARPIAVEPSVVQCVAIK